MERTHARARNIRAGPCGEGARGVRVGVPFGHLGRSLGAIPRGRVRDPMTIKLYYWPKSSATRVQWALEEIGVPYEKVRLDREKGENRTPDYLALSPQGNIPAVVDGDARLFESSAILIHLGQKHGVDKGLWPKSAAEAADAIVWVVWSSSELGLHRLSYAIQTMDAPFALPKEDRNPK